MSDIEKELGDLPSLLRREGHYSGVWFANSLIRAADILERQAAACAILQSDLDAAKEALARQCENVAFLLNNGEISERWYEKFKTELEADRATIREEEPLPAKQGE